MLKELRRSEIHQLLGELTDSEPEVACVKAHRLATGRGRGGVAGTAICVRPFESTTVLRCLKFHAV